MGGLQLLPRRLRMTAGCLKGRDVRGERMNIWGKAERGSEETVGFDRQNQLSCWVSHSQRGGAAAAVHASALVALAGGTMSDILKNEPEKCCVMRSFASTKAPTKRLRQARAAPAGHEGAGAVGGQRIHGVRRRRTVQNLREHNSQAVVRMRRLNDSPSAPTSPAACSSETRPPSCKTQLAAGCCACRRTERKSCRPRTPTPSQSPRLRVHAHVYAAHAAPETGFPRGAEPRSRPGCRGRTPPAAAPSGSAPAGSRCECRNWREP